MVAAGIISPSLPVVEYSFTIPDVLRAKDYLNHMEELNKAVARWFIPPSDFRQIKRIANISAVQVEQYDEELLLEIIRGL
jgi:hypothetical protein